MTHHNVSYKSITDRKERDRRAIQDTIEYLGQDRWELLLEIIKTDSISTINMTMGFIGVSGYPFHAICRAYRLEDYRAWMASSDGGNPVQTDAEGFTLLN